MSKPAESYGYTSVRVTLPTVAGVDSKGQAHVLSNVPVILNRVNGRERSITVLSNAGPQGKAVLRLTSGLTF